ncbi:MAG: thiamine biosynthesis protein ApbE [Caulobacteraceae bacterium]|nr:thiamine biosynthesis protein ApbE [Caulobacteraceae bacterium]
MPAASSWLLASAALIPVAVASPASAAVHRFHDDHVLGTSMDFTVTGVDAAQALQALSAARAEISRLDLVLSGWRTDSELARLNASPGPMSVSQDLFDVIENCETWRSRCDGAFTPRLGEVEAYWNVAERDGRLPTAPLLAQVASRNEAAPVFLDSATRTVDRAGVTFALDALAKGYIVDAALEAAQRAAPGAAGLMLDIGGDLRCRGAGPDGSGWRIGVADGASADNAPPARLIAVVDKAVATSGAGARDRVIDGCAYGHTLSPAVGQPVAPATVTVIADRAADADALATALSVMPVDRGLALVDRTPGAQARILTAEGDEHRTSGWDAYLIPLTAAGPSSCAPTLVALSGAAAWPAGYDVEIQYEIPQLSLGRYRPPFVAIWITDERGDLVRTLFHLGTRPRRYLDSNYVWYKAFSAEPGAVDRIDTVTRPSRQPGRYTAAWDGMDDAGHPVGQGRYTINIETSREHGGHSYQTITLDLGTKAASGAAAAGVEAGPAAARYGKPA